RADYSEQLEGVAARIVRANLGERGVWHRVQLGEYAKASQAQVLCRELTQLGHDGCWVIVTDR
ncbi:MAG: SPOR domain-containing protein, partial [Acidobacteriota bacterium]